MPISPRPDAYQRDALLAHRYCRLIGPPLLREHASGSWGQPPGPTPTGVAVFAEDVAIRRYSETGNNIVQWSDFDRGGHFAAMEAPDLLAGDIRAFFRGLP